MATDEDLERELRALAQRHDPPPALVTEAARAAFTWRTVDAELAELVYDSAVDDRLQAAVRGGQTPRLLSFEAEDVSVDLEVAVHGSHRRLMGQVAPMQPARIDIRHRDGVATLETDQVGRFVVESLPGGPVSVRCRLLGGEHPQVVSTDWLTV